MDYRSKMNQALAKIIAYKNCGKIDDAKYWQNVLDSLVRDFINS